ncbi:hypothetical protein HON36_05240 [Candidatus Parcubacteria bacterium]|jgi:hypothetical protein|nr:hypothetical protein [Candidatus Parcubacteria bacterium]MBT7228167.1 hypothetical protein [Candidatus Parcubacteria bacterium]
MLQQDEITRENINGFNKVTYYISKVVFYSALPISAILAVMDYYYHYFTIGWWWILIILSLVLSREIKTMVERSSDDNKSKK